MEPGMCLRAIVPPCHRATVPLYQTSSRITVSTSLTPATQQPEERIRPDASLGSQLGCEALKSYNSKLLTLEMQMDLKI